MPNFQKNEQILKKLHFSKFEKNQAKFENLTKIRTQSENWTKIGKIFKIWPKFDKNQAKFENLTKIKPKFENLTKIGQFF